MAGTREDEATPRDDSSFLIVNPENGGILDLIQFMVINDLEKGAKFLQSGDGDIYLEELFGNSGDAGHRWVVAVSILARKIIKLIGEPLRLTGCALEFVLNLLSLNGYLFGLLQRLLQGKVVMPIRGSETFISAIGHIDGRAALISNEPLQVQLGSRSLMDLCMMASKLAYENARVVRNVVETYWKMHFVEFYNCWNDYQKEMSTQVFIMCDKPKDAALILVSFRGTEPFDADDWITDFDYSWYEIPKLGKVHMGFLEALGLGNRRSSHTFQSNLKGQDIFPETREVTAYYAVRNKLRELLKLHSKAKLVVTGHSLGGALAVLFPAVLMLHREAEIMRKLLGIYTFGQPRVGNMQLAEYMEAHLEFRYFRVVYSNDLVPRLPYDDKAFLYKHFGRCMYYDSLYVEHGVDEEPNRNYLSLRDMAPEYVNSMWELLRSLFMGFLFGTEYRESWESFAVRLVGLAFPGISAHSPVDYVNCVRLGTPENVEMMRL